LTPGKSPEQSHDFFDWCLVVLRSFFVGKFDGVPL
jgi:hypothetical protein